VGALEGALHPLVLDEAEGLGNLSLELRLLSRGDVRAAREVLQVAVAVYVSETLRPTP
jgi:hypothetical protein